MADKDIILRINTITDKEVMEEYGEVLDKVLGSYDDNIRTLQSYRDLVKSLRADISAYNKVIAEQGDLTKEQQEDYEQLIKLERRYSQDISKLQIVLKNQEKINNSLDGSMENQAQLLGKLRMAWRKMTDEQKAANPQMLATIQALDKQLKGADASIGNFQRNVGNYPQLIQQVASQIPGLNNVAGAFGSILGAATPIGGVISAIGFAINGVTSVLSSYNSVISNSATLTYKLKDAMVESEAATDNLTRRMEQSAGAYTKVKGAMASLWGSIKTGFWRGIEREYTEISTFTSEVFKQGIVGAWKAAAEASRGVKKEYEDSIADLENLIPQINAKQQALDKMREGNVVRLAELNRDAEEQLLITREKDRYSAEERLVAAQKYEELIKERTEILKEEAELERDILVLQGERTENSHQVNMAIEQGKAKLIEIEKQEKSALRTVARVRSTIDNEVIAERRKALTKLSQEDIYARYSFNVDKDMRQQVTDAMDDIQQLIEEEVPKLEPIKGKKVSPLAKMLGITDEELASLKSQAEQAAQQIFSSIQQIAQQNTQQRLNQELAMIEGNVEKERAILKGKLDKNLISEEQYDKKLAEIEKEANERRTIANKQAFEDNKKWNIAQALMNGALALTKLFTEATVMNPATWIAAGITTATTAAQVAAITAQKYARGGELHGASHANGGIKGSVQGHNIELEGDEVVINKRSARKYRRALSWINSDNGWGVDFAGVRGAGGYTPQLKFARGGVLGSFDFAPSATPQSSSVQQAMVKQANRFEEVIAAINSRIDRLQVQVNISDIDSAHDTKQVHISRATL